MANPKFEFQTSVPNDDRLAEPDRCPNSDPNSDAHPNFRYALCESCFILWGFEVPDGEPCVHFIKRKIREKRDKIDQKRIS